MTPGALVGLIAVAIGLVAVAYLAGRRAGTTVQPWTQTDRMDWAREWTGNIMALLLVNGFLCVLLVSLLGYVDIANNAVSLLVGNAIGAISGTLRPALDRYYGRPRAIDEAGPPADPPAPSPRL